MSDYLYAKLIDKLTQRPRMRRQKRKRRSTWSKRFPRSDYGRVYVKAGTEEGLAKYGATYKDANAAQRAARFADGYSGRGDYWSDLGTKIGKYGSRAIGTLGGGALGAMSGFLAGGPAGAWSGGFAGGKAGYGIGKSFSQMQGWGDYTSNQLIAGSGDAPIRVNGNPNDLTGDVYVTHREFVCNITTPVSTAPNQSSPFSIQSFDINPGLTSTFPWLSQLAANFTLYEFAGLVFQFRPTFGESGGTTNALGKVIMGTQYDPDAPPFTSSVQMENYDYAQSSKPSIESRHGVETAQSQQFATMQYVRTGSTTKSKVFTDIGTFYIATEGVPQTASVGTQLIVGELWVSYTIKLSRAQLNTSILNSNINNARFYCLLATGATNLLQGGVVTAPSRSVVPNSQFLYASNSNNLNLTLSSSSLTAITVSWPVDINIGYYRITFCANQPVAAANRVSSTTLVNMTQTNNSFPYMLGSSENVSVVAFEPVLSAWAAATERFFAFDTVVKISSPGLNIASITFNLLNAIAVNTSWNIICHEIPSSYFNE